MYYYNSLHDFIQVLELRKYGVQLEWCQLVRYEDGGTLRKPFDEPKVGTHCVLCVCGCVYVCTTFY